MPYLQPCETKTGTGKNIYLTTADLPSQVLQYALPNGIPGGAAPGITTYFQRPINQGIPALDPQGNSYSIIGLTLNNNQITLPAGTYTIQGSVSSLMTVSKARLYDVVNNQVVALGLSVGSESRNATSTFYAEFTITEPSIFEVQSAGLQSFGGQDWGQACGFGGDEIYLQLLITKEV